MNRMFAVFAVLIACSSGVACSGSKTDSAATTTVVRQPTVADYAPRVAELANSQYECDVTSTLAYLEPCFRLTSDRLAVVTQVDPLLRQMPAGEEVNKAITMSRELLTLNSEWTSRRCAAITTPRQAMLEECATTPSAVELYFEPFAEHVAALSN